MIASPHLRRVLSGFVLVLCGVVLWMHARTYMPFMVDDAFISLRYSWRLLHGQGLTWTDGERVEGYSNFLWVLLVAAGGLVQSNLVWVARVMTFAATVVGLGLLLASGPRRAGLAGLFLSGMVALALALSGPVAAWSIGGLEQPLLVALVLAAVVASEQLLADHSTPRPGAVLLVSIPLGLLCLVRPDGAIFTVAAVLAFLFARGLQRTTLRLVFGLVLPPLLCTLGQLVFRWLYYGQGLPNTYYAKGPFRWVRVEQGWHYIGDSLIPLGALWAGGIVTLAVAAFSRRLRLRIWFPFFALFLWLTCILRIGGDIFPQRRHLLVVFALLAFLVLALLHWLWELRHWVRFSVWVLGPVLLGGLVVGQWQDPNRPWALSDTWHWSGEPVGRYLNRIFEKQRPLLATDAAGALPYFYELPCLDMLGLNDHHIATHPPPGMGGGFIGHELGDGRHVLSRKPDLIAFWTPVGANRPQWRSGGEMVKDPSFYKLYQAITFETDDASHTRTRLWLRRRDGRLGTQARGELIEVPGYLLQGDDDVVRSDGQGRLYVSIQPNKTAAVSVPNPPAARFAVQVAADGPTTVQVLAGGRTLEPDDQGAFTWDPSPAEPVGMEIRLTAGALTRAYGLVITRRSDG